MKDDELLYHEKKDESLSDLDHNILYLEYKIRELKEKQFFIMNLGGIPKCPKCKHDLTKLSSELHCLNYHCDRKIVSHDEFILDKK